MMAEMTVNFEKLSKLDHNNYDKARFYLDPAFYAPADHAAYNPFFSRAPQKCSEEFSFQEKEFPPLLQLSCKA